MTTQRLQAGTEPIARRTYPGAVHHQIELQRQTQVLLDAGIFSPWCLGLCGAGRQEGWEAAIVH